MLLFWWYSYIIYIDFSYIFLNEKSYGNTLISDISYGNFVGAKPLRIRCDEIDGFIKIYDETRYLVLGCMMQFIIGLEVKKSYKWKNGITDSINFNFARIRIDPYNSLLIEKTLTFHNVIILIKEVVNKNENNYCY